MSVVASDIGPNPQSDFADVQIDVVNTNDEVPQIGVNFMDFIELVDGEIPNRFSRFKQLCLLELEQMNLNKLLIHE